MLWSYTLSAAPSPHLPMFPVCNSLLLKEKCQIIIIIILLLFIINKRTCVSVLHKEMLSKLVKLKSLCTE